MKTRIVSIILIIITLCLDLAAQDTMRYFGSPFIRNYPNEEYIGGSQIWDIAQDSVGIMYFGNNGGLLEYDGTNWRLNPIGGYNVLRSIQIDEFGKIFVGSVNEFGYFLPNKKGELKYHSLSAQLPDSVKLFKDVWKTHITSHGVYFTSRNYIFRWFNNNLDYLYSNLGAFFTFCIDDQIYFKVRDKGLAVLKDFKITQLPQCDSIYDGTGYIFIDYHDKNKLLITTQNKGCFIYDLAKRKLQTHETNDFTKQYLKNHIVFTSLRKENKMIYSTVSGGIVLCDENGNIERIINKSRGMKSDCVYCLFSDKDDNLWAGTQNGISRIDLSYPATVYDDRHGINDFVLDFINFEGIQYVSTTNQLFYLEDYEKKLENDNQNLIPVKGVNYCWDLFKARNRLLVLHDFGIGKIEGTQFTHLFDTDRNFVGVHSEFYPNQLFIGLKSGLLIANISFSETGQVDKITDGVYVDEVKESIQQLFFDEEGSLWISPETGGLIFIRAENIQTNNFSVTKFSLSNGLPTINEPVFISNFNGYINIFTTKGIYKPVFPANGNADSLIQFVHDDYWGKEFTTDSMPVTNVVLLEKDKYLLKSYDIGVLEIKKDTTFFDIKPFLRINGIFNSSVRDNHYAYFGTHTSFFVYDLHQEKDFNKSYQTLIRTVKTTNDSVIFLGNFIKDTINYAITREQSKAFIPVLSYDNNSLRFKFSSAFYEESEKTQYQYRIEGFHNSWSNWSTETKAVFTNIPEGKYTFEVKAKNIYSTESSIGSFRFKILAPWYRTVYAYVFYFFVFILLIFGIIKIYTARLKMQNERLETLVNKRTQELIKSNTELALQKTDLEMKQEEIISQNHEISQHLAAIEAQNTELEKLSIVASEIDNGVIIMNANGDLEWINEGYTKMTGLSFEQLLQIGNNIIKVSDSENINEALSRCQSEKRAIAYSYKLKKNKGPHKWMQTTLTPIFDDNNQINKIIAVDSDITNIKNAEEKIKLQHGQIEGSIRYAKTLQNAILPRMEEINTAFNSFIVYHPKDIVSGDFYWYSKLENGNSESKEHIVAVVDCTGHGVPGAFMSLIGNTTLNEIVKQKRKHQPAEILDLMHASVKKILNQENQKNDDGMDVCICYIKENTDGKYNVIFAGAKRPLLHYIESENKIDKIKGSYKAVGGKYYDKYEYEQHQLPAKKGDILFLTSDGFVDQPNKMRQKIGTEKLVSLLLENIHLPMPELKEKLEVFLDSHTQGVSLRDDITILGIKL